MRAYFKLGASNFPGRGRHLSSVARGGWPLPGRLAGGCASFPPPAWSRPAGKNRACQSTTACVYCDRRCRL